MDRSVDYSTKDRNKAKEYNAEVNGKNETIRREHSLSQVYESKSSNLDWLKFKDNLRNPFPYHNDLSRELPYSSKSTIDNCTNKPPDSSLIDLTQCDDVVNTHTGDYPYVFNNHSQFFKSTNCNVLHTDSITSNCLGDYPNDMSNKSCAHKASIELTGTNKTCKPIAITPMHNDKIKTPLLHKDGCNITELGTYPKLITNLGQYIMKQPVGYYPLDVTSPSSKINEKNPDYEPQSHLLMNVTNATVNEAENEDSYSVKRFETTDLGNNPI
jgi:hypothetical protein